MRLLLLTSAVAFAMFLSACPRDEAPPPEERAEPAPPILEETPPEAPEPLPDETPIAEADPGAEGYRGVCAACHMPDGSGIPPTFPALAGSQVLQNTEEAVTIIIQGRGQMPPMPQLTDQQIADILTYERSSFGNDFGPVSVEEVEAIRAGL
jgi:mono/diheme cytochrome c family protein